jgi:hypothetical protein
MRSTLRIAALILVLVALLLPLATYASGGPCADDPVASANCVADAPPYYVVINRSAEYLYPDRPGSGCQPIILKHPDCLDCYSAECTAIDVEAEACALLPAPAAGDTQIVYEMCCACATNPDGEWLFRIRELQPDGTCPVTQPREGWLEGLPPGTGIDLPVPVIVGALVVLGAGLLAAGVLVRRRTLRTA